MSSQILREDASLMRGGDNSLGYPREDFERAQPPRRWPVTVPCPVHLAAWVLSVMIGYIMELTVLGVWWLGVRSTLPMTWLMTSIVLMMAFLVAAGIAAAAGGLLKSKYGSITAMLIVLIGPLLCGATAMYGGWPIAEHYYRKGDVTMDMVDPAMAPTALKRGYVHFLDGAYVDRSRVGRDIVYTDVVCAAPIVMPGANETNYFAFALNCCRGPVATCAYWQMKARKIELQHDFEITGGEVYPEPGHPPVHGAIYDAMMRHGVSPKKHDLSKVGKIKWGPDPKIAQAKRYAISTTLFISMPLLAPFFAIFVTAFFSPKATYDKREVAYPMKWEVGPEDPSMR